MAAPLLTTQRTHVQGHAGQVLSLAALWHHCLTTSEVQPTKAQAPHTDNPQTDQLNMLYLLYVRCGGVSHTFLDSIMPVTQNLRIEPPAIHACFPWDRKIEDMKMFLPFLTSDSRSHLFHHRATLITPHGAVVWLSFDADGDCVGVASAQYSVQLYHLPPTPKASICPSSAPDSVTELNLCGHLRETVEMEVTPS
jgi:hypothetical protein